MASRLISHWASNASCLHSAIDDLQSFSWVLLWVALHSPDSTPQMQKWIVSLSEDDPDALLHFKQSISAAISGVFPGLNPADFSPFFGSIFPLLSKWFAFAIEAENAVHDLAKNVDMLPFDRSKFHAELRDLSLIYYAKYLEAGVDFLRENGAYGPTAEGTQTSENTSEDVQTAAVQSPDF